MTVVLAAAVLSMVSPPPPRMLWLWYDQGGLTAPLPRETCVAFSIDPFGNI